MATAQEPATKKEIIDQSGAICREGLDAIAPHIREVNEAEREGRVRKFVRHGRRAIRTARRFVRQLDELRPPPKGRKRYRRYVNNTATALDWFDAGFDAYANRRRRLGQRRIDTAREHLARARRAGRRYPLRDSCIRFIG